MIAFLDGKLILKAEKYIVIDVSGVGYKVFLSHKSFFKLPEIGQTLKIFCFTDVKEKAIDLYGFADQKELEFFEVLNNIRGVGPKTALELSSLGPLERIKEKILAQDEKIFSGIPGIGQKKAMTIIIELGGKLKGVSGSAKKENSELKSALTSLGFNSQQISEVLAKIPKDLKKTEDQVKAALKLLTNIK